MQKYCLWGGSFAITSQWTPRSEAKYFNPTGLCPCTEIVLCSVLDHLTVALIMRRSVHLISCLHFTEEMPGWQLQGASVFFSCTVWLCMGRRFVYRDGWVQLIYLLEMTPTTTYSSCGRDQTHCFGFWTSDIFGHFNCENTGSFPSSLCPQWLLARLFAALRSGCNSPRFQYAIWS